MEYETVIGMEIHAQLATRTKVFCGCSTEFGADPNVHVCPVCLGMPGVLPVLNKEVVNLAIRGALALRAKIQGMSRFARKSYFYPDLPKGYQISQYEESFATDGYVMIDSDGKRKKIRVKRMNLEEDAGKSIHEQSTTLVDFNRCGVALLEIVTMPDLKSPEEAVAYLRTVRRQLQYAGVSSCDMEKGHFRCEPNVSVRPAGSDKLGTRTELKNLNSLKAVERGLRFEIERQIGLLKRGEQVVQQSLLWDEKEQKAAPMRAKEEAEDYRYFIEPDLVPLIVDTPWVEKVKSDVPELADDRAERFVKEYGIRPYDAGVLTSTRELADYYERTIGFHKDPTGLANWISTEVLGLMHEKGIAIRELKARPEHLAELFDLIADGSINKKMAKEIFMEMAEKGMGAKAIVSQKGLRQVTDEKELEDMITRVLSENPKEVERYFGGKDALFGFFVGQVMKASRGKANPKLVNEILRRQLDKRKNSPNSQ
ncbi:Asp-tRNA(Asn)/Glu-tRNA(Gln) amidotransferase subunit GatB [candidate division TA06 bacterium]|uniref:Aspartyl/glutamyl-tRNA(Asn/Gln) amidotransferase subunit B n=1 Tax=candidate division TA06 bacterium TaxID=2250710 RepID=A0A523UV77_UNCT6|nr:MAG: Asp-tRNA(Asn)/Glu-tRNA(Gln) amidotransferase subunit GatB [candidate division TA06 bacterium]